MSGQAVQKSSTAREAAVDSELVSTSALILISPHAAEQRGCILQSPSFINELFDIHGDLDALSDSAVLDTGLGCLGNARRFAQSGVCTPQR